jgi:hypothetical protein
VIVFSVRFSDTSRSRTFILKSVIQTVFIVCGHDLLIADSKSYCADSKPLCADSKSLVADMGCAFRPQPISRAAGRRKRGMLAVTDCVMRMDISRFGVQVMLCFNQCASVLGSLRRSCETGRLAK